MDAEAMAVKEYFIIFLPLIDQNRLLANFRLMLREAD
jgi:hypothetical protein